MTLNHQQFYHVAPRSVRGSIEQQGIDYRHGEQKWEENASGAGNFLWTNRQDASIYQKMANQLSKSDGGENWLDDSGDNYDMYEVTMPRHNAPKVRQDPEFDNARKTTQPIPRRFVRRVG